jgi:hypothetical protein
MDFNILTTIKDILMPKKTKPDVPVCECDKDQEVTPSPAPMTKADPLEDPNHPSRWKHRRRMAYISLFSIIVSTAILLGPWVPMERVEKLSDLISWFYFSLASIVGAYVGFATWSSKVSKG